MAQKKAATTKKATSVKTATASSYAGVRDHVATSLRTASLWRAIGAEFIGTFLLASIVIVCQGQPLYVLFGLVGIVLLIGAVSGAHVNPAITVGAWTTKRIGWFRALAYIIAQVLGAIVAYVTLSAFLAGADAPSAEAISYGASAPKLFEAEAISQVAEAGKQWYALFAEVLGTAILGYAVAHATRSKETLVAAFSAGTGIFIALMVGITVASYAGATSIINPAVATVLQAFDSSVWSYAVYALAPVIGGIIGFVLYDTISGKK